MEICTEHTEFSAVPRAGNVSGTNIFDNYLRFPAILAYCNYVKVYRIVDKKITDFNRKRENEILYKKKLANVSEMIRKYGNSFGAAQNRVDLGDLEKNAAN